MTFRLTTCQLAVCLENFLDSLFEAGPSFIERGFLDIAPRQLLDEPRPPVVTDRADAHAILEARCNRAIHLVPIRSEAQQALGAIHRFRSGWIAARTAQVNTVRGLLREFGFVIPVGVEKVVPQVRLLVEDADSKVPDSLRAILHVASSEIKSLDQRIKQAGKQLELEAEESPRAKMICSTPGVGLITGTALIAFVGDVDRFSSGRHFASYLGLTPRSPEMRC